MLVAYRCVVDQFLVAGNHCATSTQERSQPFPRRDVIAIVRGDRTCKSAKYNPC
jgi:hypothetical protein